MRARSRYRAAIFVSTLRWLGRRSSGASERRGGAFVSVPIRSARDGEARTNKGSGTPTDAGQILPHLAMRHRARRSTLHLSAFHRGILLGPPVSSPVQLIGERSDAVLRTAMPGFLGRGRAHDRRGSRVSPENHAPRSATGALARWALPTPPCASPEAPSAGHELPAA